MRTHDGAPVTLVGLTRRTRTRRCRSTTARGAATIKLNTEPVDWASVNLDYLDKNEYDAGACAFADGCRLLPSTTIVLHSPVLLHSYYCVQPSFARSRVQHTYEATPSSTFRAPVARPSRLVATVAAASRTALLAMGDHSSPRRTLVSMALMATRR